MKITRASFDAKGERFVGSAYGWEGDRVQIDFVGPSARLFRRVFLPEAQIVMEADDDSITFRRVDAAGDSGPGDVEDRPRGFAHGGIVKGNHGRVADVPGQPSEQDATFRKHLRRVDGKQD